MLGPSGFDDDFRLDGLTPRSRPMQRREILDKEDNELHRSGPTLREFSNKLAPLDEL